jgi:septal ring factor EnvC (AmiA/AmiB activator)
LPLSLLLLCLALPAQAQRTEKLREKQAAEKQHAALRSKLDGLKREIERTESARSNAADALAGSERAISQSNRALAELGEDQKETNARLIELTRQKQKLERDIAQRRAQLAQLARDQYQSGGADRTRLFLSGENPSQLGRDLQYLDSVSRAQAQLIARLNADLAKVADTAQEEQAAKEELQQLSREQQSQKAVLEKEKSKRATVLASISGKLEAQRKEAGKLAGDEKRMATLVDRLARLIEEQKRAEAARQAKEAEARRKLAEKRQAERRRQAERQAAKGQTAPTRKPPTESFKPEPIDDDPPPVAQKPAAPAADMPALRGHLKLPVKGELVARYGSKRGEGASWKGVFIRAAEGAPVSSLAAGTVVFADWLRGFGNLVIVDHGNQYMSIYGNNESILKRPGDKVKAQEVIASAGNSGGNEFSGLYFELRYQGRAIDPMQWMAGR